MSVYKFMFTRLVYLCVKVLYALYIAHYYISPVMLGITVSPFDNHLSLVINGRQAPLCRLLYF